MSQALPINPSSRGPEIFTASAGQTAFTGGYPLQAVDDIGVQVSTDGGNNWTLAALNGDYTVTLGTPTGGFTITFNVGRAAGDVVCHYGLAPIEDTTDFSPANTIKRAGLNAKFDRLTMYLQEARREGGRALQVPRPETGFVLPNAQARANGGAGSVLGFSGNGTAQVFSFSDKNITPIEGPYGVSATSFGCVMDDPTKAAFNAPLLLAAMAHPKVFIPPGVLYTTAGFVIPASCKTVCGMGPGVSQWLAVADDPIGQPLFVTQSHDCNINDLTIGVPISAASLVAGSHQLTWLCGATTATRFSNCQIYGAWALDLSGTSNVVLDHVEIPQYSAYGVGAFARATNVQITECQFGAGLQPVSFPAVRYGQSIAMEAPQGLTIANCKFEAAGNQVIILTPKLSDPHNIYPDNVVLTGNRIKTTGLEAVQIQNGRRITVSQNIVTGGPSVDNGIGIYANDGTADATLSTEKVTVCGNVLSDIGGNAIMINVAGVTRSVVVAGNSITNPGCSSAHTGTVHSSGIHVASPATQVVIEGNTIRDEYFTTSATSVAVGTGSKTWTVGAGLPYLPGDAVRVVSRAGPDINYLTGSVTSYSGTTLVVNVTGGAGAGSSADWNIGRMRCGILEDAGASGALIAGNSVVGGLVSTITVASATSGGLNGRTLLQGTGSDSTNATGLTIQNSEHPFAWELRVLNGGILVLAQVSSGVTTLPFSISAAGVVTFANYTAGLVSLDGSGVMSSGAATITSLANTTANRLFGSNGSGVSGLITLPAAGITLAAGALALANDLAALEGLAGTGIARRTGADAWSVGTTVSAAEGGTGLSSYTIGDMLYASGASALSALADVATGNILISGGVATAPSWGKATSAHLSGTANRLLGLGGAGAGSEITLPAAGLTLSAGALALANDLSALEGLSGTGIANRTGVDTWSLVGTSGSGNVVLVTGATLVTPTLGVASATSLALTGSSAPANGIYLPAANTVGIAANSIKVMTIAATNNGVVLFADNTASTSTATPFVMDFGGTFSSSVGVNPKWKLYNDGTTVYGLGLSSSSFDVIMGAGGAMNWYLPGPSNFARIDKPATATQMGLMLWDVDAAALVRVTRGAADSGGVGFRTLRVAN